MFLSWYCDDPEVRPRSGSLQGDLGDSEVRPRSGSLQGDLGDPEVRPRSGSLQGDLGAVSYTHLTLPTSSYV